MSLIDPNTTQDLISIYRNNLRNGALQGFQTAANATAAFENTIKQTEQEITKKNDSELTESMKPLISEAQALLSLQKDALLAQKQSSGLS